MSRKIFMIVSAVIAIIFSLGMIFTPMQFLGSFGFQVDALSMVLSRDYGTAMFAFAIALWLTRGDKASNALRAILIMWGTLHVAELAVNSYALSMHVFEIGKLVMPFVLHGIFAVGAFYYAFSMKNELER